MKKLILLVLCCLMLTACTARNTPANTVPTDTVPPTTVPETLAPETTGPTEAQATEPQVTKFTVYAPNENADGFVETEVEVEEVNHKIVLAKLIEAGALPEDVSVNALSQSGTQLTIDLNSAFREHLLSQGTAGENMLIGCLVNTYVSAYDADSVLLTVDGETLESGHVVYDFPLTATQ